MFIREFENLKSERGELLQIYAYVARVLQFPKLLLHLIYEIFREELLRELLLQLRC